MYLRNLITATTLAAAATAFAADSNFDRTLNVSGSPNVSVSTGSGYIHLNPGSADQVKITAHVRSSHGWMSGGGDVDSRIQQIVSNPPIVQNGNDITIGERHNGDLYRNITIDYDITLPKTSTIGATTGSGDQSYLTGEIEKSCTRAHADAALEFILGSRTTFIRFGSRA